MASCRHYPSPGRIDVAAHLGGIVAPPVAAPLITLAPARQGIAIELHSEPRPIGHAHLPMFNRHATLLEDLVVGVLPGIMRVAGIGQTRCGGGEMGHRHQGDAKVTIGMHAQPETKRLAEPAELRDGARTTPVVMIAQDHLHRVGAHRVRHVGETRDGDIAGQRQVDARGEQPAPHRGHAVQTRRRILQILECARQRSADP